MTDDDLDNLVTALFRDLPRSGSIAAEQYKAVCRKIVKALHEGGGHIAPEHRPDLANAGDESALEVKRMFEGGQ